MIEKYVKETTTLKDGVTEKELIEVSKDDKDVKFKHKCFHDENPPRPCILEPISK